MMNHRPTENDAQVYRDALVGEIRAQAHETAFWTGRDHFDERVLSAIARVPRHAFIPEMPTLKQAYANHPQPIGFGQTISQPYIVALMTELLNLQGNVKVLEIGAGCGYQSAVLAELGCEVYAVERLKPLADLARTTLAKLGFERVTLKCADGAKGWAEHAPFDGILVTACQDGPIPKALIEQLNPEGRMVIPLGPKWGPQMLHFGQKDAHGQFTHEPILPVSFVPLVSRPESG